MIMRLSNGLFDVLRAQFRRGALLLLAIVTSITLTLSPVLSPPANAQLNDLLSIGGSLTNSLSTCAIETVGWVICPTMLSIARLADYGWTYINQNFLRIDYSIAANNSGTYTAWRMMETIANALFVVAFMILVYSQLTGRGGGYNIKRLLPRLILSAILVNVSYYLAVVLVDVSNIMGDSILTALVKLSQGIGHSVMPVGQTPTGQATGFIDGTLTVITSSVMSRAGIVWVLLAPVAAVTISIAIISAGSLVLLIMRKVVVAMLILAAPVLFVAYLLPNLERFFYQGLRLFLQLLLLYPIIALLLGAGQIVSVTIDTVGSSDANYRAFGDFYFSINGGSGSAITDLTAAAAAVLPLLAVWFVFKRTSSVMSTAGTRLSASISERRGNRDGEKARVTGNAVAGAAAAKNTGGLGGVPNRHQAYSRNRRHSSLGGSSLTGKESAAARAGAANTRGSGAALPQDMLGASIRGEGEDTAKQLAELQNAQVDAKTDSLGIGNTVAEAVGGAETKAKEDEKVTAKDLFNNLNRSHESKDKDRKFSSGPGPAGGGGGGGSDGGTAGSAVRSSNPVTTFKAPQIAQGANIVSGSSLPQQVVRVVTVPIQVDSSSLLGQNHSSAGMSYNNMPQPPVSGTEEKAKARAQKYLFDTEQDLNDTRNQQDILEAKPANNNNNDSIPKKPESD